MPRFLNTLLPIIIVLATVLGIYHVLVMPPAAFGLADRAAAPATAVPVESAATAPPAKTVQPVVPDPELTIINGKIGRQPIYNELVANGIAPSDVLCMTAAFDGVFDFRNALPKDEYQIELTPENVLQKLTYKTGMTVRYVAVRTGDGAYRTHREDVPLETKVVSRTFVIEKSLYQAVINQGEGSHLVTAFADIFSWDIDFYLDTRKGDTIKVLFEKQYIDDRFIKYGRILAAQYIGRHNTYSAFYFDDGKQWGYFDENGAPLRKMFIRVPVKFGMRTSSFSIRRFHPVTKQYKRHTGIDYGAPRGTPIFATSGGTVDFAGWKGGYGKLVIIRHPNGYKTYYGHCSRILVKKGARVEQGQTIAKVGSTGVATGPHVHYEVRINNRPVDPNTIKTTKGTPLPASQKSSYAQLVKDRLAKLENHLLSQNP
jgi:murein DD-endopeptidase MepM/ murein hydrolase activator NlpD